ncbi:hypothetical protein [Leptothrix ochracea]|uniref:hypothetical protein n=1 Tax=Leptothrix ochracea TaxID=735331 RepID=UPI0034E2861E
MNTDDEYTKADDVSKRHAKVSTLTNMSVNPWEGGVMVQGRYCCLDERHFFIRL